MKAIYKTVTCLLLVSFLVAGLAAIPRLKTVSAQEEVDGLVNLLTITAKKVDAIPEIDGDFSDWADVGGKSIGSTTWKAAYTDNEMAMYIQWADYDANIDTRGTWNWDAGAQSWWRTGWEPGTWESFSGWRHPEWFNIAFDISTGVSGTPMADTGCGSFCHETSEGSGGKHHQTSALGAYVDSWMILAKHGFGRTGVEDMGWLQGVTSASQEGELIFNPSDPIDSRPVINGRLTFVGYAEDKVMGSADDPKFARENLADMYCRTCHEQMEVLGDPLNVNITYGDPGDLMYSENWDETHAVPLYIETNPENWVDCMVLTQAEIDAGEAVLVADLTTAEITEYGNNYAALNGTIPHLILQVPSGDQADVRVAATWYNGRWTVELKRNLVTGSDYDVQFDDLSKDYIFSVTLTAAPGAGAVSGITNTGWTLRFEQ